MVAGNRKNILLISLDDAVAFWKYKSVFGEVLQTPNLDRICGQSTSFHAAYCQVPVCSPSRASFMSGLSPHHSGIVQADSSYYEKLPPEKMWPYLLKANGYFSSPGGKVLRGYRPAPKEIHEVIYSTPHSEEHGKLKMGRRKGLFPDGEIPGHIEMGGYRGGLATVERWADKKLYDDQVARSAISFIESYDKDMPFYRDVGFQSPHGPWTTPRRFKDMYDFKNFHKPRDWADGFDENAATDAMVAKNLDSSNLRFWRQSVRNYFSALSYADYQIGRVWDALKASAFADNTLVIITSDHGFHLGERNRYTKCTLWEQAVNVPLIIHDPAQPVGQVVTDPVGLIDIGPTVMDYLDLPQIKGSVGRSLLPQMGWQRAPDRVVPTFYHGHSAIRTGKYRFIRYDDGSTQFFDLAKDWWQTKDLGADHPDYLGASAAHAACCREYGLELRPVT